MRVSILFYHEQSESNMPSLVAPGKVAMCRARQREHEPDEWSETVMKRSDKDSSPGVFSLYETDDNSFTPLTPGAVRSTLGSARPSLGQDLRYA